MSYTKTDWIDNTTLASAMNMNKIEQAIEDLDIGKEPSITEKKTAFNKNFESVDSNIKMNGAASAGTSINIAKADHVHPNDTSKANVTDLETTNQNVVKNTNDIISNVNSINSVSSELQGHKNSTVAHTAENIEYSGEVIASDVKGAIDKVNERVTTIVAGAGTSNTEILDARYDNASGITYDTLGSRMNGVSSQLADIAINVNQFGAKGDGVTDDTQAIQNAINYCITNNLNLIFSANKTYCISNTITITKLEKNINFNFAEIKAISNMDIMIEIHTVDMPLLQNKIRNIYNLNLNGNSKANTCLVIGQEHGINFYNTRLGGFLVSGLKTNPNNYELMFYHVLIQGSGVIELTGMDINSSDNHYTDVIIFDCKYGIKCNGFNFFDKCHAWLYNTALIEGSVCITCTKSSFFTSCYLDTYQKGFYLIGNYNFSINHCHLFCKETVFNSTTSTTAPYFIYLDEENVSNGIVINGCIAKPLLTAINGSFGYFCNKTNYKGQYGENKFEKYSNMPLGINSQLSIGAGYSASYNRLIKKDGRIMCETKIYKTDASNFGSGSFIVATFPTGFKPKYDKTLMAFAGYEWNLLIPVCIYIHPVNGIQVIIPTQTTYPTHIHLSFEYDTDVYTDNILNT